MSHSGLYFSGLAALPTKIISEEIMKNSGVELQATQYLSRMLAGEPGLGRVAALGG